MKKLVLFFALVSVVALTACSNKTQETTAAPATEEVAPAPAPAAPADSTVAPVDTAAATPAK